MTWPGLSTALREAVLVSVSAGACVTSTLASEGGEVTVVPLGVCALAVAVLATEPLSMSAWVTV